VGLRPSADGSAPGYPAIVFGGKHVGPPTVRLLQQADGILTFPRNLLYQTPLKVPMCLPLFRSPIRGKSRWNLEEVSLG